MNQGEYKHLSHKTLKMKLYRKLQNLLLHQCQNEFYNNDNFMMKWLYDDFIDTKEK